VAVVSPEVLFRLKAEFKGQSELDKAISSTQKLQKGFDNVGRAAQRQARVSNDNTKATNRNRMAFNQIGFQINDFSTQMQNGAKFSTAFSQQIGQLGFAMSMLGGKAGLIGGILGGIGGTVLSLAVMFGQKLVPSIFGAQNALNEAVDALSGVSFATDATSTAQGILGRVMDTTTGKIKEQDAALVALARSELIVGEALAKTRAQASRQRLEELAKQRETVMRGFGGQLELGGTGSLLGGMTEIKGPTIQAAIAFAALNGQVEVAQDQLMRASESGQILAKDLAELAPLIAEFGVESANEAMFRDARRALDTQTAFSEGEEKAAEATRTRTRELTALQRGLNGISEAVTNLQRRFESGAITEAQYTQGLASQLVLRDRLNEEHKTGIDILNEYASTADSAAKKERDLMAERFTALVEMNDMIRAKQIEALKSRGAEAREEAKNLEQSFIAIGTTISGIFKGLITGAQSFGDAIKSIIGTVIDELFRLFVVQQIVGFVSGAFQSALSGPGKVAGAAKSGGLVGGGGAGGSIMGGKMGSGGIMSASMMSGKGGIGGGAAGMVINVDARGSTDPAAVKQQVQKGILEAAPSIIAAAEASTINTLKRPRLAGAI
jgi:hypothetical protein